MARTVEHEKDLKTLEREFKNWRRKRRRGARIPEDLWGRAVAMARIHGPWRTKVRLGLNYEALRKRSQAAPLVVPNALATPALAVAEFVELPWTAADSGPECLLELERVGGSRLRVGLRGAGVRHLEAATRLLWKLGH